MWERLSHSKRTLKCVEASGMPGGESKLICRKFGFTLAEVLITLGVIGIVAAMTLPSLVSSYREKQTVAKLKQTYSLLSQGFIRVIEDNSTPDNWDLTADSQGSAEKILEMLGKYVNITKICYARNDDSCFPKTIYSLGLKHRYNRTYNNLGTARLSNGVLIAFQVVTPDCSRYMNDHKQLGNVCGGLTVDINGLAGPNVSGKDVFTFYYTKYGLMPRGTLEEEIGDGYDFRTSCSVANDWVNNGSACTAWVLYNENMDYLHCSDLSWQGKKKCSK